jgi:hypothetical protein
MSDNTTMTATDFREILKLGEVAFRFTKADGSTRLAKGTTHPGLMPEEVVNKEQTPEAKEKAAAKAAANPDIVIFWDLEAQGFRSFNITSLHDGLACMFFDKASEVAYHISTEQLAAIEILENL